MTKPDSHFHRAADGTIWTFLAEALILPIGLVSAAYLTRTLGPDGYGLFSLAATLISLAANTSNALFTRGSIKLVSEAGDWRAVATTVIRIHLAAGIAIAILTILFARPIATWLEEPRLAWCLVLFSLEPLLFALARGHRSVLIGTGRFREQSLPVAMRLISRLVLTIIFVESGLSIAGAVIGFVASTLIELVGYRRYVSPAIVRASGYSAGRVWHEITPIFLASICLAVFSRVDLFALTALGLPTREAGYYGAALNLAIVPTLFALSFTPLLLSTLNRMVRSGIHEDVRSMSRDAMRLVLGMLPFAAMTSGASNEIVQLIFGPGFAPAAPILAWLIVGKVIAVMITITFVLLIVGERPGLTTVIAAALLACAVVGHVLLIPRFGSMGAVWVTTAFEIIGAAVALLVTYRLLGVSPPLATVVRTLLVSGLAWLAAAFWPVAGSWVVVKIVLISGAIAAAYAALGEFSANELNWARSRLRVRL